MTQKKGDLDAITNIPPILKTTTLIGRLLSY